MNIEIRAMVPSDYDAVVELWQSMEGIGLSKADSREAITLYLERNLGLSQTAWCTDAVDGSQSPRLVGAVLCGHDGRRGLLHHLAVLPGYRRMGLGRMLAERCKQGLRAEGIDKCHLFVFNTNTNGRKFWQECGWYERPELTLMSAECE